MKMKKSLTVALILAMITSVGAAFAGGRDDGSRAGRTEIRWVEWKTPEVGDHVMERLRQAFNASQSEFYLTMIDRPFVGFHDNLIVQSQARNLPEIVLAQVDWIGSFAREGIIQSIDPLVAQKPADFLDQFYDALIQRVNGRLYHLPLHSGSVAMFYCPVIFEREGLRPPTTWDELLDVSRRITGGGQFAQTLTLGSEPPTNLTYDIYPLILQAGGRIVDENYMPAFNSPEGVRALEFYRELVQFSVPGVLQNGETQKRQNFPQGNVAMMIEGPWGVGIQRGINPGRNFSITTLPAGVTHGTIVRGSLLALPTTTTGNRLEGAWQAMTFIAGPEGGAIYAEGGELPANRIVANLPFVAANRDFDAFLAQMELPNAIALPHLPHQVELNRLFTIEVQHFIAGNKTAQQALDDAAARWIELLR